MRKLVDALIQLYPDTTLDELDDEMQKKPKYCERSLLIIPRGTRFREAMIFTANSKALDTFILVLIFVSCLAFLSVFVPP